MCGFAPICPTSSDWLGQTVAVRLPGNVDCRPLTQRLYQEHRIEVPVYRWNGQPLLRVSVQAYNTQADLDRLVSALQA